MTTTALSNAPNPFSDNSVSTNLPGSPVVFSEDLQKEKKKEKKDKKKDKKDKKKDKKKNKKKATYDPTAEEPAKPIRQVSFICLKILQMYTYYLL
jgi:hypothetical protein